MNPDQDPETRIADLERSLSTPPAVEAAPAVSRGPGARLGWAVLGLLVAALVVGGGMILAERNGRPVAGRATTPPVAAGDVGTTTRAPAVPGTPTSASLAPTRTPAGVPPAVPAPGDGGPVSVNGVETQRTIDCADGAFGVSISGVKNTVEVTGRCTRVDVSGIENRVRINEAGTIEVSGLNNDVRFRSGTPELSKSGIGNTLERG